MLRHLSAVFAGLVVGALFNMAVVLLNMRLLFPMPPGTRMEDPDQMGAYVASLPEVAFVVVLVAHLGQAFVGGWVAARLGASRPRSLAMVVGGLSMIGGVLNLASLPHPSWMRIEVPLYLVVAWAAGELEARRRARQRSGG